MQMESIFNEAAGDASRVEGLWRFSLAFYARPDVSEALIALQDRADVDVNLILFALWLGVSGRRRLGSTELAAAERTVGPISAEIIEPLRVLRRRLKGVADPNVQHLREGVKALELAAEKMVQTRLAYTAGPPFCGVEVPARLSAAHANLALYLGPDMNRSAEAAAIRQALEIFVRGCQSY